MKGFVNWGLLFAFPVLVVSGALRFFEPFSLAVTRIHIVFGTLLFVLVALHLAAHAYELHIEKSDTSIHYATIIELHHPDYLDVTQLRETFPAPDNRKPDTSNHIQQLVLAQHPD